MAKITFEILTSWIIFSIAGYVILIDLSIVEALPYIRAAFYIALTTYYIRKHILLKKEIKDDNDSKSSGDSNI